MLSKLRSSLRGINYKLYFSLLILGFIPTVYTTVRIFLLGQLPSEYAFSIAGQLTWINLLYEIVNEAVILPLFYFTCKVKHDNEKLTNRTQTGMLITLAIYTILSILLFIFVKPMLELMATDHTMIEASATYIRIESIANIFSILSQFALIMLVTLNKSKYLYALTGARLALCLVADVFFVSPLPFSLNLGINGIGYSNIIVNALALVLSLVFLYTEGIKLFSRSRLSFTWAKEFIKIGGISGAESLVRNSAYILMISRLVNVVDEQGTYWVANNFIWSWLLLPVLQLGELIKQECASYRENVRKNLLGYLSITAIITVTWFLSIPVWKPFMSNILCFSETGKLYHLIIVLVPFYVFYALQNVFDSIFYGLGKTEYMLFESIVTNTIYYGTAFILYISGAWIPSLISIALLFGIGNVFDSLVSLIAFKYLLKKENLSKFNNH